MTYIALMAPKTSEPTIKIEGHDVPISQAVRATQDAITRIVMRQTREQIMEQIDVTLFGAPLVERVRAHARAPRTARKVKRKGKVAAKPAAPAPTKNKTKAIPPDGVRRVLVDGIVLGAREIEGLAHFRAGKSNAEVADLMEISRGHASVLRATLTRKGALPKSKRK